MGESQGRDSGSKSERITIAVTQEQLRAARRLAERRGMDTSHLFRTLSLRTIMRLSKREVA